MEGGAIKWNFYEPLLGDVTFVGNSAGIYGNDIASVAQRLVMNDQTARLLSDAANVTAASIQGVKSGGLLNL